MIYKLNPFKNASPVRIKALLAFAVLGGHLLGVTTNGYAKPAEVKSVTKEISKEGKAKKLVEKVEMIKDTSKTNTSKIKDIEVVKEKIKKLPIYNTSESEVKMTKPRYEK